MDGFRSGQVHPSSDSSLEAWPLCSGLEVKIGHIHVALTKIFLVLDFDPQPELSSLRAGRY